MYTQTPFIRAPWLGTKGCPNKGIVRNSEHSIAHSTMDIAAMHMEREGVMNYDGMLLLKTCVL